MRRTPNRDADSSVHNFSLFSGIFQTPQTSAVLNLSSAAPANITAMKSKSRGFGRVRVLLVDDHAALAEATAEFLRFSGLEVGTALDGKEALAMAKAFRPQLVLCDLRLPDASGLEVIRALQTTLDPKQVIFALHTAMTEAEVRSFESRGDVRVISKPLTESKLNKLLDELHTKISS